MPVIPKELLAFRCVVMIPTVLLEALIDPRKNALLKGGNKSDKIDARKLPELLRAGLLSPVYHDEAGVRTLRELARTYLTMTKDVTPVMNRRKAVYRSWPFLVPVNSLRPTT
jgi:hypothetical protein